MQTLTYILIALGALVLFFLAVLIARTLAFRPKAGPALLSKDTDFDGDSVIKM